ncbi:hypothetical protein A3B45_00290 [Candidatus Daviesbacteria bacterium RIFCSPLOWO2_01_FULL_39_12]|uniref:Uncharacterized protein n=1 Tax=Candidatus Daviesbacteria bacterium RIFCSPLOWO2_01_FULL_39_12 TaxID=1797785 RepID=A0A1F5KP17_9BACT|nr:MAG: hypothetical protein A3D79_00860 [Candidatus Daviesbacteria bacterium RIFCSPHIGHO2_02_FULL_39_8]OGE42632.1 MAG: hypothetical protein A3B45_00290 [Candidatus Daviesbacteria bacterium RIFCSPLOWO2_01_FULL_39_12]
MVSKRNLLIFLNLFLTAAIIWKIIFSTYGSILSFSFWLDDWPLVWGVSQQTSPFFNPTKVVWNFEDERFTVREGFAQIWATGFLMHFFQLDPYWFHLFGLSVKFLASLSLILAGWLLTKNFLIGAISGLIFAPAFIGSESLYWYNVNGAYILIFIAAISLPFFIKGILKGNVSFIISLILIAAGIILYPPRAHVFLAFPILASIWSEKIFNKQLLIKIIILTAVIFLSYKLPAGGGAENQAYRAVIHRLIVFSGDGLNAGNHMFFTYPLVAIPLSIFSPLFLQNMIDLPQKLFFGTIPRPLASFYLWNFILFPAIWMVSLSALFKIKKDSLKLLKSKMFLLWLGIGPIWAIVNELIRNYFLEGRFWDYPTHFLFTLSVLLILFSIYCYLELKKTGWSVISKVLLSCLVLIEVSYIVNWAFDPLIHPASTSISRYLTLPNAFGSIFLASLIGLVFLLLFELFLRSKNWKNLTLKLLVQPGLVLTTFIIIYFIFHTVTSNINLSKLFIENRLLPIRDHRNVSRILNTITADLKSADKPAVVLFDSWDYAEVFAIFVHTGHSLAIWGKISNPKEFPRVYYDEKKLISEFPDLCKRFKITAKNLYRFRVEIDKATNISEQFPKLSCSNSIPAAL